MALNDPDEFDLIVLIVLINILAESFLGVLLDLLEQRLNISNVLVNSEPIY
jgi:hypothetical protein